MTMQKIEMAKSFESSKTSAVMVNWYEGAVTNAPRRPVVPDEFADGAVGLRAIYGELRSLCISDPTEENSQPSDSALARTWEILEGTAYAMMQNRVDADRSWDFPKGYVNVDDCGGIRIEWWHGRSHCVTLVVGHDANAPTYIFVKSGTADDGRMIRRVYPNRLALRLHELIQESTSQG